MERIVIVGSPGAGKSTAATSLGRRLGLPIVHLDALYYGPNWQSGDQTKFAARLRDAHAGTRWISEGNFIAASAEMRFSRADTIVWLEQPLWRRWLRATLRGIKRETGRADQAGGCRDSIDLAQIRDIQAFDHVDRPLIEQAIARYAPNARVIRLSGDAQINAFTKNPASFAA